MLLLLAACGPGPGTVDNAEVIIGESAIFTEEEILAAVEVVKQSFSDYQGCELRRLAYDETYSVREYKLEEEETVRENAIALCGDFYVNHKVNAGNSSFSPDTLYTDCTWYLLRDGAGGEWEIRDAGWA